MDEGGFRFQRARGATPSFLKRLARGLKKSGTLTGANSFLICYSNPCLRSVAAAMTRLATSFIVSMVTLIASAAPAFSQSDDAKLLETFFELGLPEVKGAKWVQAYGEDGEQAQLPGGYNANYKGNAWLVSEANGVVEVVFVDGRRVKGRKGDANSLASDGEPRIMIQPAKLDADLKALGKQLKSPEGFSRRSNNPDDLARMAGGALVALAQFQRNGQGDFVKEHFPYAVRIAGSPAKALDGAVGLIADTAMGEVCAKFYENGNAAACATAVEGLAAKFPRGWKQRDASLMFAARLREQKLSSQAGDPAAKAAAAVLLALRAQDAGQIGGLGNWMLPKLPDDGGGERRGRAFSRRRHRSFSDFSDDESAVKDGPLSRFLAKSREALPGLVQLLGDQRFVRFPMQRGRSHSYFSSRMNRDEVLRQQYDALSRPAELGEIARILIGEVAPNDFEESDDDLRKWAASAVAKTDEELAWDYLRNSNSTNDGAFSMGLSFLVAKGGDETLRKLREVFLDPGVWNSNSLDTVGEQAAAWLKRAKPEPEFGPKLVAAAKSGLKRESDEQARYFERNDNAEYAKQFAARQKALTAKLDGLFKPQKPLAERIAEIATMDETEASGFLQTLRKDFEKASPEELLSAILPVAAAAKSAEVKFALIGSLYREAGKAADAAKIPPAVREAMLTLLRDTGEVSNRWNPGNRQKIAEVAAGVIVMSYCPAKDRMKWQTYGMNMPRLATKWMLHSAQEIAAGKSAPPLPDPAKADGPALVKELGALTAAAVAGAFDKKSPNEQIAIVAHLEKSSDWPASLVEFHFTIAEVTDTSEGAPPGFDAAKWKGRRLDEAALRELMEFTEKTLLTTPVMLSISINSPLAGVAVSVGKWEQKVGPQQIEQMGLPKGDSKPDAVWLAAIRISKDNAGEEETSRNSAGFGYLAWKDEAKTRAWRDKNAKAVAKPANEEEDTPFGPQKLDTNPAKFEQKLKDWLSMKAGSRGAALIYFSATKVSEKDEPNL